MAHKSTSDTYLTKMVRLAQSTPISIAVGQGESEETHCLALFDQLEGKALYKKVKRDNPDTERWGFGKAKLSGKKLMIIAEKKFSGMSKLVKEICHEKGLKVGKCILLKEAEFPAE